MPMLVYEMVGWFFVRHSVYVLTPSSAEVKEK